MINFLLQVAQRGEALNFDEVRDTYRGYYEKVKPYIKELFSIVQDGLKANKHFLLEQAMGTFLDTDWGITLPKNRALHLAKPNSDN